MSNPHSIKSHPSRSRGQHSTRHRRQRLSTHQLTGLDLRIHEHLLTHRVLTTTQLVQLTQSPERTVRYRLERLHRAGHLGRTRPAADSGSAPAQWWLSTKGARAVNAGAPASATPKPLFLAHAVATAELYVALARVADTSGLRLVSWLRDEQSWEEWRSHYGRRAICPDASAQLELEIDGVPGVVDAFIEIDLGTMTQARLRAKVTGFREYLGDNAWHARHQHPPLLLVVTMSETRATTFLSGLHRATRHLQWSNSVDDSDDSAAVAVSSQVRDPEAAVLSAVWRTSAEGRPCRLNELVATAVHRYRWSAARGLVEALAQVRLAPGAALEVLLHDIDPDALHDAQAAEALSAIRGLLRWASPHHESAWADAHALLVLELAAWWREWKHDPYRGVDAPATVITGLRRLVPELWREQVEHVLDAIRRDEEDRRLPRMVQTLAAGQLVDGWRISDLSRHIDWAAAEQATRATYVRQREDAIYSARWRLPWYRRRRFSRAGFEARWNAEHLVQCVECGMVRSRERSPTYCEFCRGHLVAWGHAPPVAQLSEILPGLQGLR